MAFCSLTSWLGLDSYRDGPLDYAYLDRGSGEAIGNTKSSRWGPYTISLVDILQQNSYAVMEQPNFGAIARTVSGSSFEVMLMKPCNFETFLLKM
ncbi:hypothetical protein ARMSODRAFT_1027272 [Armillaria solidipes]|uniref:Uncharacterized protein n=1 Tax=Armillaria solidipes TaxID=1076256 RepID=A0A2H3ASB9_9AGAR|nr:hypothetical protein ARMSODRAFT_1027272 [Armillaria solidipes]